VGGPAEEGTAPSVQKGGEIGEKSGLHGYCTMQMELAIQLGRRISFILMLYIHILFDIFSGNS